MKVVYVIPTHFDVSSVIAGAERYAYGLARAMARRAETVLVTFDRKRRVWRDHGLTLQYRKRLFSIGHQINPFCVSFLADLRDADVVHCLQPRTFVTELAILYGAATGKRVFLTDLAGGSRFNLSTLIRVFKRVDGWLFISEYNRGFQRDPVRWSRIIYGGVDETQFSPDESREKRGFLYIGRLFPLKGLDHLIEALPAGEHLDVVGTAHDVTYMARLRELARGKSVAFLGGLGDEALIQKYRAARATVLPVLVDGGFTTAMESMACGTPVIGTRVGSLPEVVSDGMTGFLCEPGDIGGLRERISWCRDNAEATRDMGGRGREDVLKRFTWDSVAERCLEAYQVVLDAPR